MNECQIEGSVEGTALVKKKGLKTNQEISLTKLSLREMPAPASKMEEWVSPMKSEDTTCRTQVRFNT